ncbi:nucleotide disphospho-sugar-binding domain-containing protein [Streptomyces daliensis]
MTRVRRVLFVVDAHPGHIHATLLLARRMTEAGARVDYCGPPRARDTVSAHGHGFLPLYATGLDDPACGAPRPPGPLRRRLTARHRIRGLVRAARDEIAAVVRETRPELVVMDPFLLPFYPFWWAEGVPVVALSTKTLFRRDAHTPPYTSGLVPRSTTWGRCQVQLRWAWQWAGYWTFRVTAAAAGLRSGWSVRRIMRAASREARFPFRKRFVRRPLSYDIRFDGTLELVLASRHFEFSPDPAPPGARYAGPCVDLEREEPPFDWSWLEPGRKLAYFSVGTVALSIDPTCARLARNVAAAFAGDPEWALLITVPDERIIASLDGVGDNVHAVTWAPQLATLRRASVALTHGGHNSVKECLLLGVPMVVFPRRVDQFGNAARVVFHGVGRRGRADRDTAGDIRRAATGVAADPEVRARLDRLGGILRKEDPGDGIVAELLAAPGPARGRGTGLADGARPEAARPEGGRRNGAWPREREPEEASPDGAWRAGPAPVTPWWRRVPAAARRDGAAVRGRERSACPPARGARRP